MSFIYEVYYYWTEHHDSTNSFERVVYRSVDEDDARKWYDSFNPKRKTLPPYTNIVPKVKTLVKVPLGEVDNVEDEQLAQDEIKPTRLEKELPNDDKTTVIHHLT